MSARLALAGLLVLALSPSASRAQSPPAKLNPPANAKAIWIERDSTPRSFSRTHRPSGAATVQRTDSGAVLKWRAKGTSSYQGPVRQAAATLQLAQPSQVRQAAQLTPLDPFQDPFGDSVAQNDDNGSFPIDPPMTQAAPMDGEPMDLPSAGTPESAPSDEEPRGFRRPDFSPPEALPEPSGSSEEYRGRNCDEEQEDCELIRETVNNNTIDKIELNITPTIEPEAESMDEMDEAKRQRLAEMPAREWRNRNGQVVAEGKIVDFRNRRAIIQGSDGQVAHVPFNELGRQEICFLTAWWELPTECILSDARRHLDEGREEWIAATYTWTASALCHKPLYFEERALERYGHTTGPLVQPLKSGAHFFLNIAFLPYKMGMYPPNECRYALGYYRPGDCAPWMVDPIPFSLRGALFQAGAAVGVAAVIP